MKNRKGFTLIELLAVIVILGLLMAIAIPSVTRYITQSRKKTLVNSIDSFITAATTAVNDNEFGSLSDQNIIYYIPVSNEASNSCISLEKGGTDPFGNWKEAYVAVNYDATNYSYDYYFTFYDDAGYGMELTKVDEIDASGSTIKNPTPVNADNITTQIEGRASESKVLLSSSCDVKNTVSGGNISEENNNQESNNGESDVQPQILTTTMNSPDTNQVYVTITYESGMTWGEFINSDYNTDNLFYINADGVVAYNSNEFAGPVGNDAVSVTSSTPMDKAYRYYHVFPGYTVSYLTGDVNN